MTTNERFIDDVIAVVDSSRLIQAVQHFVRATGEAWRTSLTRAVLRRLFSEHLEDRVHAVWLAGWMGLGAIVTRVMLAGLDRLLDPPILGIGWLAAAPLTVICIAKPAAVAAAWEEWWNRT